MIQDKMKTLSEKTQSFLNITKVVEKWAAMFPDPKAMKQFKDGKNLLKEARADLDFILQIIDTTQDVESPHELPEKLFDKLSEESPDELPKESSDQLPEDSPDNLPEELPGQLSEESPDNLPEELPGQLSEESPDNLPEELPGQLSEESPDNLPEELPGQLSEESPDNLPEELPGQLPEESQDELPKESSDQAPSKSPEETSDESPVTLPFKSNLSGDAREFNPLVKSVPQSQVPTYNPEYSASIQYPSPAVPIFYGDPRYWMVFKESFEKVIHESPYLSVSEKVGYLVGYLDGDARSLVASIPPFEENYDLIWNTLLEKYEDPSATFKRYDFSPRTHTPRTCLETFYYLQEVLDYCFMIHNTLSRMNFEALGDYVVYEIAQSKLDSDMFSQLVKDLNQDQIPTFDQTSGFLQHHIQKMERMSKEIKKAQFRNQKLGRSQGLVTTTFDAKICQLCRESTHKLFNCKGFLDLTPINRFAFIKTNNRCFNCLGERHSVPMCLSENVCAFCKKRHHSLLHDEEIQPDGHCHLKFPSEDGVEGQTITVPVHVIKEESVMLATAAITAFGNDDHYTIPARALLDSASQCHLISDRCRIALNLPLLPLDSALSGVGDVQRGIMGTTVVKFSPYFNTRHTVSVIAYVIENICYDLPSVQIAPRIKEGLTRFKLADPNFDIPSPVDLLIGSEMFPVVLKRKQYRVPDSFCYGLETIFGWIVMGRAPATGPVDPRFQTLCCVNAIRHTLRRLQDINEYFHPEKFPELMKELQ